MLQFLYSKSIKYLSHINIIYTSFIHVKIFEIFEHESVQENLVFLFSLNVLPNYLPNVHD